MHRAVAARLADPKISLFEALKIGGFEYENDNDANAPDSEHITLGQRKNQLSRRVRLGRQQLNDEHDSSNNHSNIPDKNVSSNTSRALDASENLAASDLSFRRICSSTSNVAGNKRPFLLEDGDGGLSDDPAARMNDVLPGDDTIMSEQSRIMAKNHPGYYPILLNQRITRPTDSHAGMGNDYNIDMDEAGNPLSFPLPQPLAFRNPGGWFAPPTSFTAETTNFDHMFPPPSGGTRRGSVSAQQQHLGTAFQPHGGAAMLHNNLASRSNSSNRVSTRRNPPSHQDKQAPPSDTIASLNQTAASAGMSLRQLAVALRKTNNLAEILAPKGRWPTPAQHKLALSIYQAENRALYQRSMLLAGFPPEIAQDERSEQHIQMAINACQAEGQRLNSLMNESQGSMAPPLEVDAPCTGHESSGNANTTRNDYTSHYHDGTESDRHTDPGGHHHCHHEMSTGPGKGGCVLEDGRHIHRLEGKCGHKAILHQPADGVAHIDFVVGNHIECYHRVEPLSSNSSQDSSSSIKIWPSSYKCKDLSCHDCCKDAELGCKAKKYKNSLSDCCAVGDPKILDLDDIDLEGSEWHSDFSNGDTVLGLLKLGADTKSNSHSIYAESSDAIFEIHNKRSFLLQADLVNE